MSLRPFADRWPELADGVYIDESAVVIGDVTLHDQVSLWPGVVVRGDVHRIVIGSRTNIQDGSVLHVSSPKEETPEGYPLLIGEEVTVGHRVVLHGCTIGNHCLIGMGAVVLDGAIIEDEVIVGAGSLVTQGKRLKSGYIYVGSPARKMRRLTGKERHQLRRTAVHYVSLAQRHSLTPR